MEPVLLENRLITILDDPVNVRSPEHRPHMSPTNRDKKPTRNVSVKSLQRNTDSVCSRRIVDECVIFHTSLPQMPERF